MAVLPSFYDSFTKGRRDAIDFQNLIDERARREAMFPEELAGKQINNQYMGAIRDRMVSDNQYNQELRPDKLNAERTGYQAATAGNQNAVDFYRTGNQMVSDAQARAASPELGMQNALFLRSLFSNPGYYGSQQLNPQANNNLFGESALDQWARANGYQKSGPSAQNLSTSPASNSPAGSVPAPAGGGVAPLIDYGYQPIRGRVGVSDAANNIPVKPFELKDDIVSLAQKQTPNIVQPDAYSGAYENLIRGMTNLGLDPALAQKTLDYDAQLGLPPGTLAALGYAESKFNPNAVSSAGAAGMWQIMPNNWTPYGGVDFDPTNPEQNLSAAVKLLQERQRAYGADQPLDDLLRRYNGRMDLDLSKVGYAARKENLEFPGRVRDAYQKISGFVGP